MFTIMAANVVNPPERVKPPLEAMAVRAQPQHIISGISPSLKVVEGRMEVA